MGLFRVIYGFLYPSGPTPTYKDKQQDLAPKPSAPEANSTPSFRPRRNRAGIFGGFRNTRRRSAGLIVCVLLAAVILYWKFPHDPSKQSCPSCECTFPPEDGAEPRHRDSKDTFAEFKHRGMDCNISSLDLHKPFGSICPDKSSVLQAMSNGGRVGKDAPYLPRGCDMRWYDTEEVCEILNRFSQVVLVGDSMLRHIIGALACIKYPLS